MFDLVQNTVLVREISSSFITPDIISMQVIIFECLATRLECYLSSLAQTLISLKVILLYKAEPDLEHLADI